jgi:hypothetical protein
MGNDKSILEKITDTVKDIATLATDAANHALKAEEPPLKEAEQPAVAYMPLAGDALISDPMMMVSPIAVAPAPRRKRAAPKRAAKRASKKTAKKAVKKSARTAAKKSVAKKSAAKKTGKAAKKSAEKASKKTAKKVTKKTRKAKRG